MATPLSPCTSIISLSRKFPIPIAPLCLRGDLNRSDRIIQLLGLLSPPFPKSAQVGVVLSSPHTPNLLEIGGMVKIMNVCHCCYCYEPESLEGFL